MNMKAPTCCLNCCFFNNCNSAMYTKGCRFFPPKEKKISPLFKLIGKLFK